MSTVRVLTDGHSRDLADALRGRLAASGHTVDLQEVPRFPKGDSLPALLGAGNPGPDATVVVVDPREPDAHWVLHEIAIVALYPRHFLGLARAADAPDTPLIEEDRIVALDAQNLTLQPIENDRRLTER
jgi:hypothetical protein